MARHAAYLASSLMQGVILRGTGRKASRLGRPLAGKTGRPGLFTETETDFDDFRVTRWER